MARQIMAYRTVTGRLVRRTATEETWVGSDTIVVSDTSLSADGNSLGPGDTTHLGLQRNLW